MKVVLLLEEKVTAGGGFQQALLTIDFCQCYGDQQYMFMVVTTKRCNIPVLQAAGVHHIHYFPKNFYPRGRVRRWAFENFLKRQCCDLVYFLSPSNLAVDLSYNFIYTLWDVCHADQPEFPEVREYGQFQYRERLYHHVLPRAVCVTVDAAVTKEKVIAQYGVHADRIAVLPFLPSLSVLHNHEEINVKQHYAVNGDYIFYPAHFSAHKNHVYILQALKILQELHGVTMHAVFSGAGGNQQDYVQAQIAHLGLSEQVHCIGFAPAEHLAALYQQSIALVMPTYFGVTNIPPLEAWYLGVPVFYSDLPGLCDQVADASVLMNLRDPADLAYNLMAMQKGHIDVEQIILNGKQRVKRWTAQQSWRVIAEQLSTYKIKQSCWKSYHHALG